MLLRVFFYWSCYRVAGPERVHHRGGGEEIPRLGADAAAGDGSQRGRKVCQRGGPISVQESQNKVGVWKKRRLREHLIMNDDYIYIYTALSL